MSPLFPWLLAACLFPAVGLAAVAPTEAGGRLATVAGSLELPFAYEVKSREIGAGTLAGNWTREDITLLPTEGAWGGSELEIRIHYISPNRLDSGFVQSMVRSDVEEAASDPGTTRVESVKLASFDFNLLELVRPVGDESQRITRLVGTINGAMLSIEAIKPADDAPDASIRAMLPGLALDFASLMRLRGQFERERDRIVKERSMATPVGLLEAPRGVEPRLISLSILRDGAGRPLRESHQYGFYRAGFWTQQRTGIYLSCDRRVDDAGVSEDALQPFRNTPLVTVAPDTSPDTIGGAAATLIVARRAAGENSVDSDIRRWVAIDDQRLIVAQVERVDGLALAQGIERQMKEVTFGCDMDSQIGAIAANAVKGEQE